MLSIWSVLQYVLWALEKNVYFTCVGWSLLQILTRFCQWMGLVDSSVSLVIFCLVVSLVVDTCMLKFSAVSADSIVCVCVVVIFIGVQLIHNVVLVSGVPQNKSVIYIHVYSFRFFSLIYVVAGLYQLSILYIAVCIYQSHSPNLFLPYFIPWQP